uniref:chitobiase/beta-hexosaminidase C-terminal domain-containing protein n=1 Tax=uncultured Flavonifractor sp. TaxID=1193534 RepID=UPI002625D439
ASGDSYWMLDGSGSIQMTARTLGASASLPSGTYDMQLEQPELRMATKITVPGQEIFYTILGQSADKQPYTDPIPLTQDTKLLVYGQLSDAVYQVSYYTYRDLRNPVRAAQEAGTYDKPIQVELNTEAGGAVIYYTTDGSDPTTSGTRYTYTSPIGIFSTTTIRAAAAVGGVFGDVLSYEYVISPAITAQPGEGDYTQPVEVTLTIMDGYGLWYTTDGRDPTRGWGIKYEGPITICQTTELKVAAFRNGSWGEVKTFSYRYPQVTITAQPAGGEYEDALWVTLACSADYAQLSYRLSGGTEQAYEDGIGIYKTTQLTVYARYGNQLMATETFTYTLPNTEIQASPAPGNYQTIQTIALSCNRADAELWYALDSWYLEEDGTRYTGPFELDHTSTIWVSAKLWGETIAKTSFVYNLVLPKVTASPAPGEYKVPTPVTLSTDAGYEIWYTVDGSDPKTNGLKYEGPIQLDEPVSTVIRAVPKSKDFENVWGTTSEFSYNMTLPEVKASPVSGDYKVPLSVTLSTDAGYEILYTLDGSDPAVNGIKYEGAFQLEEPVSTVVRVALKAEDYEKVWSVDKEFRYTFNSYFFRVQDVEVEKRENYEITARLTNTLLEEKAVTLYAAAYRNGKQLDAAMKQVTLPANTRSQTVSFTYPSAQLLPEDAQLKVFCLDSATQEPLCEAWTFTPSEIEVVYILDSLTARPAAIEGTEGDVIPVELTAHYLNGKADQTVNPYSYSSGNSYVARASSGYVTLVAEGSTTVTYTYIAGGVAKSVEIPVTVKAPTYHLGFLADPTADTLPADAIPISSAQELAAIKSADSVGKTYYLTQDIQLTGEWSPVYGFQGTLDGRGHTVSGLYVSSASEEQLAGLFASAYDATIKNLTVEIDPRGVSAYHASDVSYAGGLVGHSKNTNYINCYTTGGPVSASGMAPYAGGLVGYLMNKPEKQIVNCFSTCDASAQAFQSTSGNVCLAGGLIADLESGSGYQAASLSRCYATGDVSVSYPGGSGGVAGTQAGGLIGKGNQLDISDCFALGDVTARRSGTITVSGLFAGGLGGWLIQTELTRCYAAGDVFGGSNSYVGGLTAAAATINSCYRVGQSVTGTEYYNGGTAVTAPYAQNSYSGFDFTSTWQFTQGAFRGLPHLQYQD